MIRQEEVYHIGRIGRPHGIKGELIFMFSDDVFDQVDADYLIYNASIDAPLTSVDDLLGKSGLFADFRAVKEGNVWSTDKYLYQATDIVGELITDINRMLTGQAEGMTFIHRL